MLATKPQDLLIGNVDNVDIRQLNDQGGLSVGPCRNNTGTIYCLSFGVLITVSST